MNTSNTSNSTITVNLTPGTHTLNIVVVAQSRNSSVYSSCTVNSINVNNTGFTLIKSNERDGKPREAKNITQQTSITTFGRHIDNSIFV